MTAPVLYALVGALLFGITLHAVIFTADPLRRVIALNVMSSAVFLFLVALARRAPTEQPDPVPQAMAITGIVVAISATALAIVLINRLRSATGGAAGEGPDGEQP